MGALEIFVQNVNTRNWVAAADQLNGSAMYDILPFLAAHGSNSAISANNISGILRNRGWFGAAQRIEWAGEVVRTRKIQNPPPGLPADQVTDAQKFLARLTAKAGPLPRSFNIDMLRAIMTNATEAQSVRYFQLLVRMMADNQINTGLRMAHFLAQLGHESGDLRFSEEIANGDLYEGRADLGNTQPGDGRRFKGRGLIQLTGRANYTAFGTARQRDFVTVPNNVLLATDPNLAVDVSCWFWATRGLNVMADADNLEGITRRINGRLNGLADRSAHLQRARPLLVH